jgi:hypothetical protein
MKKNFLLSIALCFSLLFALALPAAFAESASDEAGIVNNEKSITKAYNYPVKPKTEKWKALKSTEEKVKVTKIPDSILNKMTTEALVETVMNYPLLANMTSFNTRKQGFNAVYGAFNGLQELTKRTDAVFELEQFQNKIGALETSDNTIILQELLIGALIEGVSSTSLVSSNSMVTPYYTNSSVNTPKGTAVSTYKDLTWADHGMTSAQGAASQAAHIAAYPNATVVSAQDPDFNCHSYAWYSTFNNSHWMNSASSYKTDGSYTTAGGGKIGSRVDYGAADHSGIAVGYSSYGVSLTSKWGYNGVFTHWYADSPYTMNGPGTYNITFWNKA